MSEQQKIFFSTNLKFLRNRKQLSQEMLAEQLDLSRVKLNALESGKTKNPAVEDLVKFSDYFKMSIDSLVKVKLSNLLEMQLRDLEAGNDVYMMGTKLRVLPITVDKDNHQNSDYVPIKAKMGYRNGYGDPEYIASLPKFNFPSLPRHKTYRTFPAGGNSMPPIPDEAEVTGEYVENWLEIKPDTPCIVVLKGTDDFVFKLVTIGEDKSILLKSTNPSYAPYMVSADKVLEIWKFRKLHLDKIPDPPTEMQEVKQMLDAMRSEIKLLKK